MAAASPKADEPYSPRAILFTGGAGFIGSNVMVHIMDQHPNAFMLCVDSLEYCANIKNMDCCRSRPNFRFVKGSITNADLINMLLSEYKIDTVMHFAAQTHVDNSFGNSFRFTESNVMGTHVLLEACKLHKKAIRRFIHVSTDEVYGESPLGEKADRNLENKSMHPTNPYAATKAAAECLVTSYRLSFDLPIITTRGNNVYGPHQFPEKLIPKFATLISKGQKCPIHGDGSNLRSYLYVTDVATAFDAILQHGTVGKIYNIGSKYEYSNRQVLDKLLDYFGIEGEERQNRVLFVKDRAFNDLRYHIDTSRLEGLGWKQKVNFDDGIKMTVDWYLENPDWWEDIDDALKPHPTAHQDLKATAGMTETAEQSSQKASLENGKRPAKKAKTKK